MPWNHRVIKTVHPIPGTSESETFYQIHEVYYDKDANIPTSCTVTAVAPGGETIDELRAELERMLKCLDKPSIDMEYFEKRPRDEEAPSESEPVKYGDAEGEVCPVCKQKV